MKTICFSFRFELLLLQNLKQFHIIFLIKPNVKREAVLFLRGKQKYNIEQQS
jgi:hypothetical protein